MFCRVLRSSTADKAPPMIAFASKDHLLYMDVPEASFPYPGTLSTSSGRNQNEASKAQ